MKTLILKISFLILFASIIFGCGAGTDPLPAATCDASSTDFQMLYGAAPLTNAVTYDSEIHSYNFEVTANKNICSVGYQSQPAISSTPYLMEIEDVTVPASPVLIGSVSSTFSSTATSYAPFATSVPVMVGRKYKVKRIQTMWGTNIANTIGRLKHVSSGTIPFPLTYGNLVITSSSLYQNAATSNDWGLPYIDIVFE